MIAFLCLYRRAVFVEHRLRFSVEQHLARWSLADRSGCAMSWAFGGLFDGSAGERSRRLLCLGKVGAEGVLAQGWGVPMLIEDGLVVVGAYLDWACQHLDMVDPTVTAAGPAGGEAPDRPVASRQLRSASFDLERAGNYLRAAQRTIGDVFDDVARGFVGRVGEDLRLLKGQCEMAEQLSELAARTITSTSRDYAAPEDLGRGLSASLSSIGQVRSSAQAAARLASELAADHPTATSVTAERAAERLRAEQWSGRPATRTASAMGVPR